MFQWLSLIPVWQLGLLLFAAIGLAAWLGLYLHRYLERRVPNFSAKRNETREGYVVSGVLALLALLIGFTFSMVVERFEARRALVVEDANAIETLSLRAQLLGEPHRSRLSGLMEHYVDNRVELAQANGDVADRLLRDNQRLLLEIWKATIPAFNSIRDLDFSAAFVDSANDVIALDAQRKAVRRAQIPAPIFALLFVYTIAASMVVSYVMGESVKPATATMLALFTLVLLLMSDLNQPVNGMIRESQGPMLRVQEMIHDNPPARFITPPLPPAPGT